MFAVIMVSILTITAIPGFLQSIAMIKQSVQAEISASSRRGVLATTQRRKVPSSQAVPNLINPTVAGITTDTAKYIAIAVMKEANFAKRTFSLLLPAMTAACILLSSKAPVT